MTADALLEAVQGFDERLKRVESDTVELADVILGTREGHLVRAEDGLIHIVGQVKQCLASIKQDILEIKENGNGKKGAAALWAYRASVMAALLTGTIAILIHAI